MKNILRWLLSLSLITISNTSFSQLPVIVKEDFDVNHYGWPESSAQGHKVYFARGKYVIEAGDLGWMPTVLPYIDPQKNISLEATFVQVDGRDDNGYGLVWGFDGKSSMNSFSVSASGYFRLSCADRSLNISDEWRPSKEIKGIGKENRLKLEQTGNSLRFFINGKLVASSKTFPWKGSYIGFVAYTKMKLLVDDFVLAHDIRIDKVSTAEAPNERENLGAQINSVYDDVSPKISSDGKTLYFGRKLSPLNVGGIDDKEDIWISQSTDGMQWSAAKNIGAPVNTSSTNNLIAVSTDNNSLLFHTNTGFAFMHRTENGWSPLEDLGIVFKNESSYLEGCLSPDGKAILFVAKLKSNLFYKQQLQERDIYVCVKGVNGKWSNPIHTGKVLNSAGDEYSPFLSADGRTLYFATNGRPGYGSTDIFMSRRLSDDWVQWSVPLNLGLGVNTVGFDAYYTLPASGHYGYMVSKIQSVGLSDIIRFKLPHDIKPDPVILVSGKVLHAKTKKPVTASIRFDDLSTNTEVGEARVDPRTGEFKIVLPAGTNYGFHAAAPGYLSVNENIELTNVEKYGEVKKDLLLVPIQIGESIQLKNVFFAQSQSELLPESFPELNRLVKIMKDNPTIEIELDGHTDSQGNPQSNLELSEKRVEAVKQYLVSKGVAARRITGRGFGGSQPIAPSTSEENRQLNRRVEFKIVKK